MENSLKEFCSSYFKAPFEFTPLLGDASNRKYYSLKSKGSENILCVYSPDESEAYFNFKFFQELFVKNKISTPKVYTFDDRHFFMILENLGSTSLEDHYKQTHSLDLHKKSIDELLKLQTVATKTLSFRFTQKKFNWEFDFAIKHLTQLFSLDLKKDFLTDLNSEFGFLSQVLTSEDTEVLTHRDYHSRNIMVHENQPYLIDFQDARLANPYYDLASLVEDTYVNLSDQEKLTLLKYYKEKSPLSFNDKTYSYQVIQRSIKACGSFAYLKNSKGLDRYLQYLSPSYINIQKHLKITPFPAISQFIQILIEANPDD